MFAFSWRIRQVYMYNKNEILAYLIKYYPDTDTKKICQDLGLSLNAVYTLATRNGIHKSNEYLKKQHAELMKIKKKKYLASIPDVNLTQMEQNIIVGSILGDGSLTFSPRSRNAYYREHFSVKQKEYREWKMNSIHSVKFRIENGCHLKSQSHPVFTELYNNFFINGIKTITPENIKLLNHPVGLAALYLDDGTLSIYPLKSKNNIRIFYTASIITLSFSKSECQLLADYIFNTFNILFNISPYPCGKGWILKTSRLQETLKFFDLIYPYCKNIPCLKYKLDLHYRLKQKKEELISKHSKEYTISISSIENMPSYYSAEDEDKIVSMKKDGKTYNEIAAAVGRSYNAITYKIHHLRQQGKI